MRLSPTMAALALSSLLLGGCATQPAARAPTPSEASLEAAQVVPVYLPLSGRNADEGRLLADVVQLVERRVFDTRRPAERPLRFEIRDAGARPDDLGDRLEQDRPDRFVAPPGTDWARAALEHVAGSGVLVALPLVHQPNGAPPQGGPRAPLSPRPAVVVGFVSPVAVPLGLGAPGGLRMPTPSHIDPGLPPAAFEPDRELAVLALYETLAAEANWLRGRRAPWQLAFGPVHDLAVTGGQRAPAPRGDEGDEGDEGDGGDGGDEGDEGDEGSFYALHRLYLRGAGGTAP